MKNYILFLIFLVFSCKQNNAKKEIIVEHKVSSIAKDSVFVKKITTNETCPCNMPRMEERYGIIEYKGSLTDNQEKLLIKLCENENNTFAISIESDINLGYDKSERGKIYDYKNLGKIEGDKDLVYFELPCILEDNLEPLYIIETSKGVHSIWRIKEGKLIEMDKNKEYPCIDFDKDME